jgi:hypothetical protein
LQKIVSIDSGQQNQEAYQEQLHQHKPKGDLAEDGRLEKIWLKIKKMLSNY